MSDVKKCFSKERGTKSLDDLKKHTSALSSLSSATAATASPLDGVICGICFDVSFCR